MRKSPLADLGVTGGIFNMLTRIWILIRNLQFAIIYLPCVRIRLHHEGNPADLRNRVHPDLEKTGFIDVVNRVLAETYPADD